MGVCVCGWVGGGGAREPTHKILSHDIIVYTSLAPTPQQQQHIITEQAMDFEHSFKSRSRFQLQDFISCFHWDKQVKENSNQMSPGNMESMLCVWGWT